MTWREAAISHAKLMAPNESCGLLIDVAGDTIYVACRNLADDTDHFIIHPADWAKTEDQADIIAIVHSHPNQSPEPSAMDRQFCERSQLPWHIVNPADGSWSYCEPSKLVKAVR